MRWFAFDCRKHHTWALAQNETGKNSSLLPTTYAPLRTRSARPMMENRW